MVVEASAVSAAIGVVRLARDALKGLKQMGLSSEHKEAVQTALDQLGDVQDRISDIQSESIDLREENAALRQQISDADTWSERIENYSLFKTPGGAHVYRAVPEDGPTHYACPACVENLAIQVLQDERSYFGTYSCPACKAEYLVNHKQSD